MPDRLPSLILLVGCWVPPAALGWAAAEYVNRKAARVRASLACAVLAALVVAWSAVWFLLQLRRIPPYVPGATLDPTFAPPEAVAGLAVVASALVLPASAIACLIACRLHARALMRPAVPRAPTRAN